MFEGDVSALSLTDLLKSAGEHQVERYRCEARLLLHAACFADLAGLTAGTRSGLATDAGRERLMVYGGEGCPPIPEFAAAEFGAMIGISAGAAAHYIGQALALRHRLPFTWARVMAGEAIPWRACKIADACQDLSAEAAAIVDKRVCSIIDTVTPRRLDRIVKSAVWQADPAAAQAAAEQKAREHGVYVGPSDEHGSKTIWIRADAGAVIRFDATIEQIAEALKILGDTRPLATRRAKAIGIIADPRFTEELLLEARNNPPAPHRPEPATHDTPQPRPDAKAEQHKAEPDTDDAVGAIVPPALLLADWAEYAPAESVAPKPVKPEPAAPEPVAVEPGFEWEEWRLVEPEPVGLESESVPEPGPEPEAVLEPEDEADRDAPHPGSSELPDPLDSFTRPSPQPGHGLDRDTAADPGEPLGDAARRALNARLAQIKLNAHAHAHARTATTRTVTRPRQTEVYVHLTDHTLATGTGVLRVENLGPMLASQLAELVGYGPYCVKPVIDLNDPDGDGDALSVDAYEIPNRIRERVKLIHPVEQFPYGTAESTLHIDLDHIEPYDPTGPPGQTRIDNLIPLRRFSHRVKTHGGWQVRRLNDDALEWTTPHGFKFIVDHQGTRPADRF